jgi:outer membrane protein OmpA-like peptidoglycan-associated protein
MEFSGLTSNLPGFNIETYIWDFGDGSGTTGSQVNHIFNKAGIYDVKLGVSGYYEATKQKETKCVIKPIAIGMDNQELVMSLAGINPTTDVDEPEDIRADTNNNSKNFSISIVKIYLLAELPAEIVAKINNELSGLADASIEFKRSEVSGDDIKMLDRVVKILEDNPDIIMEIAAHTDNIESFENSIIISQKRVEAIVDYLVSKGIEKQRLVGKGYGESNPISSNSTEEGRMKNYRVEFIILNDKQ